jgi:hypothetical protein
MFKSIDSNVGKQSTEKVKTGIKISEHIWAAVGLVFGIALLYPDVKSDKFSALGAFGVILAVVFFFVDAVLSAASANERISEKLENVGLKVLDELKDVGSAVSDNTHTLKAHQLLLASRTTDNLTLIAFKNLLAYLPFYLAEDLGYFQDEHIAINKFMPSLDDQTTARLLQENAGSAIAICDPYMCVSNLGLRMVYPICTGIAAWPMTLNWIGSTAASNRQVKIAAYRAPSTTHVLAQFVARNVISPLLPTASGIAVSVVELADEEASFGESEIREDVSGRLHDLLMKYDVVMLWEPHCELALSLGARYLQRSQYETKLQEFGFPLYSGLVLSQHLIYSNPTLPIRLRRGLDRAVARLQDPNRLRYCMPTLTQRRLLNGFTDQVRESVLNRLVRSMPVPTDSRELKVAGWANAAWSWADWIYAADNLRQSLIKNDPHLRATFQISEHSLTNAGEFRQLMYAPAPGEP